MNELHCTIVLIHITEFLDTQEERVSRYTALSPAGWRVKTRQGKFPHRRKHLNSLGLVPREIIHSPAG